MVLALHVLLALASIGQTSFALLAPTQRKLNVSYALVAMTLGSGTYLIASRHGQMLEACMVGLLYIGFIAVGLATARRRLAASRIRSDSQQ